MLKHAARLLPRNRRVVFAALSARVGSIGDNALGGWYSYRASKAALNQLLHTASIELARTHRHAICVALHPGTVATPFTRNYPDHQTITPQQAADNLLAVTDQLTVQDTGAVLRLGRKARAVVILFRPRVEIEIWPTCRYNPTRNL